MFENAKQWEEAAFGQLERQGTPPFRQLFASLSVLLHDLLHSSEEESQEETEHSICHDERKERPKEHMKQMSSCFSLRVCLHCCTCFLSFLIPQV